MWDAAGHDDDDVMMEVKEEDTSLRYKANESINQPSV